MDGTCASDGGCPDCKLSPVGPNCRVQGKIYENETHIYQLCLYIQYDKVSPYPSQRYCSPFLFIVTFSKMFYLAKKLKPCFLSLIFFSLIQGTRTLTRRYIVGIIIMNCWHIANTSNVCMICVHVAFSITCICFLAYYHGWALRQTINT